MFNKRFLFVTGLLVAAAVIVAGCAAPAPASKAIARGQIESGNIVPSDQLRVAEYLSYYKQNFPAPIN